METLLQKLSDHELIDSEGNIILEVYEDGSYQGVRVYVFVGFFGGTDYSYNQLIAADAGKGYLQFFDDWKSKGIIE